MIFAKSLFEDGQGALVGGLGGGIVGPALEIQARLIERRSCLQAHLKGLGVGGRSLGVGQ